jgi:hypothetical protein
MNRTTVMQRQSGSEWRTRAAEVIARFPLAATDWDAHEKHLKALRNAEIAASLAPPAPDLEEPPLDPYEEEQLATLF